MRDQTMMKMNASKTKLQQMKTLTTTCYPLPLALQVSIAPMEPICYSQVVNYPDSGGLQWHLNLKPCKNKEHGP